MKSHAPQEPITLVTNHRQLLVSCMDIPVTGLTRFREAQICSIHFFFISLNPDSDHQI